MKKASKQEFDRLSAEAERLTRNVLKAYTNPLGDLYGAFGEYEKWHASIGNASLRAYFKQVCIMNVYAATDDYTDVNIWFLGDIYSKRELDLLALKN